MHKYAIIDKTLGYQTKPDVTNNDARYLVDGSQNVLINDGEKVEIRGGYELKGSAGATGFEIERKYDWVTSSQVTRNLRTTNDEIQYWYEDDWYTLQDGFTDASFDFAPWWSADEDIDLLLMVRGDSNIYMWSGLVTEIASVTANTITKSGTTTWAEERAITGAGGTISFSKTIIINGTTYTYTGGESTTTLTGVTPDPTGDVSAGDRAHQGLSTFANTPAAGFDNDGIYVHNNQLHVGSLDSRDVYISADDNFTDFTFSSPRVPGEGALITLDQSWRAFVDQPNAMYISAGEAEWYETKYTQLEVGTTLTEILDIQKLRVGAGMGARSQQLVSKMGNAIAFLNYNNELILFGDIENLQSQQFIVLSDPIKPDFDDADFTNAQLFVHKNRVYISAPNDFTVFINERRINAQGQQTYFWQAPQVLAVQCFSNIDGDIHGHSSYEAETYKLFTTTADNGNSFKANATYAYRNFGDRVNLKQFLEYYVEGYIKANTAIDVTLRYDYDGSAQTSEFEIDGSDATILRVGSTLGSLGDTSLGELSLGGTPDDSTMNIKFQMIKQLPPTDFHEMNVTFETDGVDKQWEILAHGPDVFINGAQPTAIKQ